MPPMKKTLLTPALDAPGNEPSPLRPYSGLSTLKWRCQRLLQIGSPNATAPSEAAAGETSSLRPSPEFRSASYGTLPASARVG